MSSVENACKAISSFLSGRLDGKSQEFPNDIQVYALIAFFVAFICALVANVFCWMLYNNVGLKVSRTMKSFDEKLNLAMELMKRRKFSEDMIGQLSVLAKFDLQGDRDDEEQWQSKIESLVPSHA